MEWTGGTIGFVQIENDPRLDEWNPGAVCWSDSARSGSASMPRLFRQVDHDRWWACHCGLLAEIAELFGHRIMLLRFKLSHWLQWLRVLRIERRSIRPISLLRSVARGVASKMVWIRRMRDCRPCPIYDRSLRRCRPNDGSPLGCGCWMPLKAMFADSECWAWRYPWLGVRGWRK